jgi:hypothetical protein
MSVQTAEVGLASSSHGTALVALPAMKNMAGGSRVQFLAEAQRQEIIASGGHTNGQPG